MLSQLSQHRCLRANSCSRSASSYTSKPTTFCLRHVSSIATPFTRHAGKQRQSGNLCLVRSTPDTEEARSPLDAPQEWETPRPSNRPDIFPEFEKMDRVFLPKPLPGDPEMPDEESEELQKRTTPGDPDPEQKPGEPPEPEAPPAPEPGQEPEKPGTDIPTNPE